MLLRRGYGRNPMGYDTGDLVQGQVDVSSRGPFTYERTV
jgi:hypothetical protein